jgi:PAS domain-containing protein
MDPRVFFVIPFAAAALALLIIGIVMLSRKDVRGGSTLFFLCLAAAVWSMTEGLLYLGFSERINIIITKVQYIGVAALPLLALAMVLRVFGLVSGVTRKIGYALTGVAALIVVEVWLNDLHHLHFTVFHTIDSGPFPMLGITRGPLWWCVISYQYLLILVTTIIIAHHVRSPIRIYRRQALDLLISILVVWLATAVYVAGISGVNNVDTGPLAFAVVAASFMWRFFKFNMYDIAPAMKAEIFSSLQDTILIVDENERVAEINRTASELLMLTPSRVVGTKIRDALPLFSVLSTAIEAGTSTEMDIGSYWGVKHFDIKVSDLTDRKGHIFGKLVILSDITTRKNLEKVR